MERIQKILAAAGIASRRKCEELIDRSLVKVNGKIAKLGDKADPAIDTIELDGRPITIQKKVYLLLNKPKGYVTTVSEEHEMKTVMELVKVPQKVFPVGRLDKNTEGLLILTNDGELANQLTHPSYGVEKEYVASLDKPLTPRHLQHLESGVEIDGRKVRLSKLDVAGTNVRLRIHEGRKHIVRLLFEALGIYVKKLVRVRMGTLDLGSLHAGKWRHITEKELKALKLKGNQKAEAMAGRKARQLDNTKKKP